MILAYREQFVLLDWTLKSSTNCCAHALIAAVFISLLLDAFFLIYFVDCPRDN